jgi:glutamine synthetase adenylyltransferase
MPSDKSSEFTDPRIRVTTENAAKKMLALLTKQKEGGWTSLEYAQYMAMYQDHMEEILETYLEFKETWPRQDD